MARTPTSQAPLRIAGVSKRETRTQFAALCYRVSKTPKGKKGKEAAPAVEILLVSSRDTGRWIIPKGWPMDGMTPAAAAAQEAWEEAGVRGRAHGQCVGLYAYDKWLDEELSLPCIVAVFPVEVKKLDKDFPESDERKRKWFSPKKAAQKVDEPELKVILESFDPARLY
ncbi:NUDIX hydrolase [Roseibacterium beibuensis]|uniref:NUDIX hydrolase n=1 Tax=[Roseibacterium] beibuensis TaxID=1193142 RepID=UPI00217DF2C6|nr:NUDIX hydrolase [Roseibacterium beibuensis]MCS6622144.1 NUDIX hydrolase [Roseibacterium beibuensis]